MEILVFSLLIFAVLEDVSAQGRTPPPTFRLESTATDSFNILWQRPSTSATITGWRIQYREAGQKKRQIDIDGGLTEQLISGLQPGLEYKVRMMAMTDRGNGKYSAWKGVVTATQAATAVETPPPSTPVPESPQNVVADPTATSARVTWDPPVDNGAEIIGYVISYGPLDNPRENVFTLRPSPTYSDLDGLTRNVQYQVSITAYNTNGQSYPTVINFNTIGVQEEVEDEVQEEVKGPPPQPENVQYENISPTSVRITWTLPQTTEGSEIENIRFGFGLEGTRVEYLPSSDLGKAATSYIAEQLTPGTRYIVMLITQNANGESDPVLLNMETSTPAVTEAPQEVVVPPPVQMRAEVLDATTVRLSFIDPSIGQETTNDRYYTLRYKRDSDPSYEYANIRETTYTIEYLTAETNYQFDIMVVLGRDLHSEYSTVYAFTSDPNSADMVRGVTAIQVKVTNPGLLSAVINWLPPQNIQGQIRGYVLEYTSGIDVTPSTTWERININGQIPTATIEPLMANTTYHVRVAPRDGNQVGEFSNPPELFLTPTVPPSGQPLHVCSSSETTQQVVERVNWMRDGGGIARPALVGVPLPYCDDYYGIHECHGLVCFCIPGKRPRTDAACTISGPQGDQPFPGSSSAATPCRAAYDSAKRSMDEARKAGKPLYGVNLPYCTQEGYYQPKQCAGSVCFCSTWDGQHTGKEVPLWEAASLDC